MEFCRAGALPADLGKVGLKTMTAEPIRDTRTQSAGRSTIVLGRSTQDVTNLRFHAASMSVRSALQACLNVIFQLAHYDLGHEEPPRNAIMIALEGSMFKNGHDRENLGTESSIRRRASLGCGGDLFARRQTPNVAPTLVFPPCNSWVITC